MDSIASKWMWLDWCWTSPEHDWTTLRTMRTKSDWLHCEMMESGFLWICPVNSATIHLSFFGSKSIFEILPLSSALSSISYLTCEFAETFFGFSQTTPSLGLMQECFRVLIFLQWGSLTQMLELNVGFIELSWVTSLSCIHVFQPDECPLFVSSCTFFKFDLRP